MLSAHLDHIGRGEPVNGDSIYNGAMDNASGTATMLEAARLLHESGVRLRRSVVFLAVTAEEHGLLGSRYFTAHPTVPASALVANLNTDMFLPLFPMHSLIVNGLEESDLADDLRRVGRAAGIAIIGDPEPERNAFVRSDQYSFIRRGIPAVAFKIGWTLGSPEHEVVKRWRAERYHAPLRRSEPADRSPGGRRFHALLHVGRGGDCESRHAAAVERRQLLQALRHQLTACKRARRCLPPATCWACPCHLSSGCRSAAPDWQGGRSEHIGDIRATSNAASRDAARQALCA